MTLHNKGRLNEFCLEHNLRTPKTVRLDSIEARRSALCEKHKFPIYLKYPVSCATIGVQKIASMAELHNAMEKLKAETYADPSLAPILQQGIQGYQIATQAVYKDGEMLSIHMYKNLAEFPPGSGTGVVRESVSHLGIKATMKKLGVELNYNGLLGVDFLIDLETKKAFLIDANPRLPLGYQNSYIAGANLMESYIDGVEGRTFVHEGYREGVKTRSLVPHLYWFFASIFKLKENPFKVVRTYWKDRKNAFPEIFDMADPIPTVMLPWILFRVQFQDGKTVMDKFLNGAVFNEETFVRI